MSPTGGVTPQSAGGAATASAAEAAPSGESRRHLGHDLATIGKSVVIKGELRGSEDLTIEGQVEGTIELRQNVLTIGANGKIRAQVVAKAVIVLGEVTGNITATETVEIREHGSVEGDLVAPRVAIADGAHFRGSIDMQGGQASTKPPASPAGEPPSEARRAQLPAPARTAAGSPPGTPR